MQLEVHSHAIEYVDPDGKALARVTFPDRADGTVDIDHTFVRVPARAGRGEHADARGGRGAARDGTSGAPELQLCQELV